MKVSVRKQGRGTAMAPAHPPDQPIQDRKKGPELAALIDGIAADNRHDVVDFGARIGREDW